MPLTVIHTSAMLGVLKVWISRYGGGWGETRKRGETREKELSSPLSCASRTPGATTLVTSRAGSPLRIDGTGNRARGLTATHWLLNARDLRTEKSSPLSPLSPLSTPDASSLLTERTGSPCPRTRSTGGGGTPAQKCPPLVPTPHSPSPQKNVNIINVSLWGKFSVALCVQFEVIYRITR
jgi:hypothetical protein